MKLRISSRSLIIFALCLAGISALAYANLIPRAIRFIPYYDSIGHFVLFGLLGVIAHYAFKRRRVPAFGRNIPLGPTLAIVFACIDESLQIFSYNRTFDLMDLFFGILGILFFITLAWFIRNWRSIDFGFYARELLMFGIQEARAALFPALFLFLLFISHYISFGLSRYDFLFAAAVAIQIIMVLFKLETLDEAKTIVLFHIIGLILEIYKTSPAIGSWSYPEPGFLKIAGVPLFSGFMYAAVGSYIAHAWKVMQLRLERYPSYTLSILVCALIYVNFFTNHFFYDIRLFLFAAIFALFYKTNVHFTVRTKEYRMPLVISFVLIAFFIWLAENIGTFYGAWQYPSQIHAWSAVSLQKITSWFLLVIICFIIVSYLKHYKSAHETKPLDLKS